MRVCRSWRKGGFEEYSAELGRCYGTRECDPCNCGGDESKCDFYPEKRKAAQNRKHPFYITCMNCGSNDIAVYAFDNDDLEIRCKRCGASVNCGSYYTQIGDYSD